MTAAASADLTNFFMIPLSVDGVQAMAVSLAVGLAKECWVAALKKSIAAPPYA
ncbi:MAG: hypothetical protein ACK4TQ_06540 [Hydrogenophaga sp.]|jgi:hypothetical protein